MSVIVRFDSPHDGEPQRRTHVPPRDEHVALADVTRQCLERFAARRMWLRRARAASFIGVGLCVILVVALVVDGFLDVAAARWMAAGLFYAALVLGVVAYYAAGLGRRMVDLPQEARRIERLVPNLREQLLAAVELSDPSRPPSGSAAFQQHLQAQTAAAVQTLDMERLLPWRRIRTWPGALAVLLAGLLLLCLLPNLHLPQRLARVLAPLANVGRISRIAISIERPLPASRLVPRDDIVSIVARASGAPPAELRLQTRGSNQSISSLPMTKLTAEPLSTSTARRAAKEEAERFEGTMVATREWTEYRVIGDGAETPWYRLSTRPRPRVLEFDKRITPPAYAGLGPQRLREAHGNFSGIVVGSTIRLQVLVDQPVVHAELRWSPAGAPDGTNAEALALRPIDVANGTGANADSAAHVFAVEFPAIRSTKFQVFLQAAETGFANDFSDSYLLDVIDDLPPSIAWLRPQTSSQIVTAEQTLALTVEVADQMSLRSVALQARRGTNQTGWQTLATPLKITSGGAQPDRIAAWSQRSQASKPSEAFQRFNADWQLDLLPLKLLGGDMLELQAVAVDRQGQSSATPPLRIYVAATSLVLDFDAQLIQRLRLAEQLEACVDGLKQRADKFEAAWEQPRSTPSDWSAVTTATAELAGFVTTQTSESLKILDGLTESDPNGLSSHERQRLGEALISLGCNAAVELQLASERVREVAAADAAYAIPAARQLKGLPRTLEEAMAVLAAEFRVLISHDIISQHASLLQQINREQGDLLDEMRRVLENTSIPASSPGKSGANAMQIADADKTQQQLEQLRRRQDVQLRQLLQARDFVSDSVRHLSPASARQLQRSIADLSRHIETTGSLIFRDQINAAEQQPVSQSPFDRRALERLVQSLERTMQALQDLSRPSQLGHNASASLESSYSRLEAAAPTLDLTSRELSHLSSTSMVRNLSGEQQPSPPAPALNELEARIALRRVDPQTDRRWTTDLSLALRALQWHLDGEGTPAKAGGQPGSGKPIAEAVAVLQSVAAVHDAEALLKELLQHESRHNYTRGGTSWATSPEDSLPALASASETTHPPRVSQAEDGFRVWLAAAARLQRAAAELGDEYGDLSVPEESLRVLRELTQSEPAQKIQRQLGQRPRGSIASLLVELNDWNTKASRVSRGLEPIAERARERLRALAPSVATLARRAAERTLRVKQGTEQLSGELERGQVPAPDTRLAGLQLEAASLSQPLAMLRTALADQADAQDLLDPEQLRQAQLADAAVELVDNLEPAITTSVDPARAAHAQLASPAALPALRDAAKVQAAAAAALEGIAELFDAPANEDSRPRSSAERFQQQLAELQHQAQSLSAAGEPDNAKAKEKEVAEERNQRYEQAEQLSQLAAEDPAAALRRLEEELPSNTPMQQAMSEIAQQTVGLALQELRQAAGQQATIASELAQSDIHFRNQQELWLHDLRIVTETINQQLSGTLLADARWTAGAAKQPEAEKSLQDVWTKLQTAVAAVVSFLPNRAPGSQGERSLANASVAPPLAVAALDLREQLRQVEQTLQVVEQDLRTTSREEFHQNGADLSNRRREMLDRGRRLQQQLARLAQEIERRQQQRRREATVGEREAEQRVQQAAQQTQKLRRQLDSNSDGASLRQQLAESLRHLEQARAESNAAAALGQALDQRVTEAKQALKELNNRPMSDLSSVNPTAELSSELASQAAALSRSLAQQLELALNRPVAAPRAAEEALQSAQDVDADVRRQVSASAQELARAERHEKRLRHDNQSEKLRRVADEVAEVVAGPIMASAQALTLAARDARENDAAPQASATLTSAARQASDAAHRAIAAAAESVAQLLPQTGAESPSANESNDSQMASSQPSDSQPSESSTAQPGDSRPSDSSQPSQGASGSPLSDQQKAELLDELDRRLEQRATDAEEPGELNLGAKEDDSQAPQASTAPPKTLSEAAEQLARNLSRSRRPPPSTASTPDVGMQTEPGQAAVEPQAPVTVRVLDPQRLDGDWGKLREQSTDDLTQSHREAVDPRYRRQVEAYFRELSQRGRQ